MPFAPGKNSCGVGVPYSYFIPAPTTIPAVAPSGMLTGTIIDANGFPVSGAQVVAFTSDNNLYAGKVISNPDGTFVIYTPFIYNPHFIIAESASGNVVGTSLENIFPNAPFSPGQIAGLVLWFDASGLVANSTNTYGTTSGSSVVQWNDLATGNNAVQVTGSAQPTIISAAQNGLNVLHFTVANSQYLSLTTSLNVDSGYTCISVIRRTNPSGRIIVLGQFGGNGVATMFYPTGTIYCTNSSGYNGSNVAESDYNFDMVSVDIASSSADIYYNGVSTGATFSSDATYPATSFNAIGQGFGGSYNDGDMAEFVLYTGVLSKVNRQNVEGYLRTKWGTP